MIISPSVTETAEESFQTIVKNSFHQRRRKKIDSLGRQLTDTAKQFTCSEGYGPAILWARFCGN